MKKILQSISFVLATSRIRFTNKLVDIPAQHTNKIFFISIQSLVPYKDKHL